MNQKEAAPAPRILNLDIPVNNTLYEVEELIKDIEKTSFKLLSDITLTNTDTQKILIIPLILETSLIIPKKPTEFLDLPVEIRNIIKDFTFNDYDNGKDLKKTFNKQFTNIDNVILLKKMFGEYPKELILNDNDYNYNLNKYNTKWNKMRIPENIKNNFIDILNKYNLIKFNPKYNKILLNLYVCLYNDLNFDIILSVYETYTPYIKLEPDEIIGGCGFLGLGKYITREGQFKIAEAVQSNTFHIDKLGCIYNDFDDADTDDFLISDLIGGIKYKDMYDLITYIKNKLYNS
jgi:hypothetical protein